VCLLFPGALESLFVYLLRPTEQISLGFEQIKYFYTRELVNF
jgi:hypothetical protein